MFLVRCSEKNSGQNSSEGRRYGRDGSFGQGFLVDKGEEVHRGNRFATSEKQTNVAHHRENLRLF